LCGFTEDERVYCSTDGGCSWRALAERGREGPGFVYGARLCPVGRRTGMVHGGLTSGGYVGERNDTLFVTFDEVEGYAEWTRMPKWGPSEEEEEGGQLAVHQPGGIRAPAQRGYHSVTLLGDGRTALVFGGIRDGGPCALGELVDVPTGRWRVLAAEGPAPPPRFGHSATLLPDGNRVLLIGGSTGGDLLRSGTDYADAYLLHTAAGPMMRWEAVNVHHAAPGPRRAPRNFGREHTATLIGHKLVLFGGHRYLTRALSVLDTETMTLTHPTVADRSSRPMARHSHGAVAVGGQVLVFGGFVSRLGASADLWKLSLTAGRGEGGAQKVRDNGDDDNNNDNDDDDNDDPEDQEVAYGARALLLQALFRNVY
jgi:hypothetical protein